MRPLNCSTRPRIAAAFPPCLVVALAIGAALIAPAPADASATIYFRGSNSSQTGSGASSITLSAPSNTAVGDMLMIDIDAEGTGAVTLPSGWTNLFAGTSDWSSCCVATTYAISGYRVATSADIGASYTISLGSSRKAVARILGYVGASSIDRTSAGNTGFGTATSFNFPSITTTQANDVVILGGAFYNSSGTFTFTAPSGTHDRVNLKTTGSGSVVLGDESDFTQATAATIPTKTGTLSTASDWGALTTSLAPATSGTLQFATAPQSPSLPTVTLNGAAQTKNAQMNNFAVDDTTGTGSGWNVTVNGQTGTGFSPVFAQYCSSAGGCANASGGTDPQGYVSGGQTLSANSLTLNTTGASWSTTGGSGSSPTFSCASGCHVDSSSATKIASAASGGAGAGPWVTSGFSATSLALTAPTTLHSLPSSETYRVDLVWTLSSGP